MLIKAGELISKSIDLYKENWKLFFQYLGLYLVPAVLMWLAAMWFIPTAVLSTQGTQTIDVFRNVGAGSIALYVAFVIALAVISLWFSIAFLKAIAARYQKQEAKKLADTLKGSAKLIVPAILAVILVGLIVIGGTLLLIIPGVIFSLWFAFALYAVAIDEQKPMDALKASKALVKGRWWGVFWRLLAPAFVFGIAASIAQWIVALLLGPLGNTLAMTYVTGILSMIVSLLFTPLTTAAPTILYLELKKTPMASVTPEQLAPKA